MTGVWVVFSEINLRVHGIVCFGDGSMATIEGHGSILVKCKTDAHKVLTRVFYIRRLMANIISLGQLEEEAYKIMLHDGFLRLLDRVGMLVAKVKRGMNRLYIISLNVDRLMCLAAQGTSLAWRWHSRYAFELPQPQALGGGRHGEGTTADRPCRLGQQQLPRGEAEVCHIPGHSQVPCTGEVGAGEQ
jgi:hypothetical protein